LQKIEYSRIFFIFPSTPGKNKKIKKILENCNISENNIINVCICMIIFMGHVGSSWHLHMLMSGNG
jgi:hypothetical protein